MKFLRLTALLLAAMLCLAACSAKEEENTAEPTAAPTAEAAAETAEEAVAPVAASNESVMVSALGMPYESWMDESMYSSFAATFFMDLAFVDAFEITRLSTELGVPAVYVGELEGDNYGNGMNLALFFTDPETSEVTMLNATVYLKTGLFEGYVTENAGDPVAMMESLVADGTLKVYHPVTTEDFMYSYSTINQIMSGAATAQ